MRGLEGETEELFGEVIGPEHAALCVENDDDLGKRVE